jgi:secreted trypsin-like serine protease
MRGRRLACLAGTLTAVLCSAPAHAAQGPRIIDGHAASPGEYPAQGYLELSTTQGTFVCGGSLVSNRSFLTAAHCATQPGTNTPLAADKFHVTLGSTSKHAGTRYSVSARAVKDDYDYRGPTNDLALLTLATPAPSELTPLRLIEADESALWTAGKDATIIGWGTTENGALSDQLLEATVPMVSDAGCTDVWGNSFRAATMVCAGGGETDTCGGDSGGPLMVSDGSFLVLAGLTSWGADPCAAEGVPGVYTRLGAPALNAWVRARVPMARASVDDAAVDAGHPVTFTVTATHPSGTFTDFAWDFDSDGAPDATGAQATHAFPAEGRYVTKVTASGVGADTATDRVAVQVGDSVATPTPTPTPTTAPRPAPAPAPPAAPPVPSPVVTVVGAQGPLATILVTGRPRVRHGRFPIRVRFAATAPAGVAVVEVMRGRRVIGIARTRVVRGATKRLRVKLTPRGRRLLTRSRSQRLKLKVRVRVGRPVLRSKTLTVRR